MHELVDWLIEIEDAAYRAYAMASALFPGDPDFSALLVSLANDERSHCNAMRKAKACLDGLEDCPAVLSLDEETKWDIEAPFIELRSRLDGGEIARNELMNFILVIEYSELNQLFLYVLNAVNERTGGAVNLFMDIEEHKGRIEKYVASHAGFEGFLERIRGLPGASSERKILIVDDTQSNVSLLKAIFEGHFIVETASNGAEALEKLTSEYYCAVISDVDMPVMDGLEFYMKAREIIPGISGRFLFFTGSLDMDRISFFNENRLKYIQKPTPINRIRAAVQKIAC